MIEVLLLVPVYPEAIISYLKLEIEFKFILAPAVADNAGIEVITPSLYTGSPNVSLSNACLEQKIGTLNPSY